MKKALFLAACIVFIANAQIIDPPSDALVGETFTITDTLKSGSATVKKIQYTEVYDPRYVQYVGFTKGTVDGGMTVTGGASGEIIIAVDAGQDGFMAGVIIKLQFRAVKAGIPIFSSRNETQWNVAGKEFRLTSLPQEGLPVRIGEVAAVKTSTVSKP